jgi:2-amino-4-hydroxy-6-hydroxymethyldihydropteridine diphosphokinase
MVFLGLGGNLGDVVSTIDVAVHLLSNIPDTQFVKLSPLYRNPPMGPAEQPDYINAVCQIITGLTAKQLLAQTQNIENLLGRVRGKEQWGARTLDIDILLYGQEIVNEPGLIIPHYGIAERAFVLVPLSDITDELIIPEKGHIKDLLAKVNVSEMSEIKK